MIVAQTDCSTTPSSPTAQPTVTSSSFLIGINYAITNQHNITSYLIGTIHCVDEESFDNDEIKKIINSCSFLYTEAGKHTFNLRPNS